MFGWVQLWGIRREAKHVQSSAALPYVVLHEASVMDRTAIPDQYDRSGEVVQQAAEKRDDLDTGDVLRGELGIHAQPRSAGRNRESGDGGKDIPAAGVVEKRRF